ncbi:AAA family ATPase [Pseudomonas frederiksbergensis]|uniref:AAA family ATPase n=1 Tax=Pseudomonas frederiksbergensis TaxID=104087 RepID=UPI003D987541
MKLLKFTATNVHGYINFDIEFNKDVNFIAGLNGSGKTTALNLISSMLAPSIEELVKIKFDEATLHLNINDTISFSITAKQQNDSIELSTSALPEEPVISANLQEFRHSKDRSSANKFRSLKTFSFISSLPSPMFLSLDRRFIKEVTSYDSSPLSVIFEEKSRSADADGSMKEALELISKKSAELKDKQTLEDRKLRDKIILDSFHVYDRNMTGMALPNSKTPLELKAKQKTIKNTLISLDFKTEEFEEMYDNFFDNLIGLSKNVFELFSKPRPDSTKSSATQKKKGVASIPPPKSASVTFENSQSLGKWFANSHQMARIDRLLKLIDDYEKAKTEIYRPLVKFETLVNSFLEQTDKKIKVTNRGEVTIFIGGFERSLTILSSGERQILIMLAHLSLNSMLPQSGIFIVDEPELSLHISWQDMFLEAVQAAGPELQIILATHSPAIIGGRNQYYIPLNGGI